MISININVVKKTITNLILNIPFMVTEQAGSDMSRSSLKKIKLILKIILL